MTQVRRTLDVDAFIDAHQGEWRRLEELSRRRRRSGAEADELVALYRRAATHLSLVQSRMPDPALVSRLSRLLSQARAAAVGTATAGGWAGVARGVRVDFPVAVYRTGRWSLGAAAASIAVMVAMWLWLDAHPDRVARVATPGEVRQLVDRDFADYYTASPARSFAAQVWTNNALVAALCLFLGVTLVGTVGVLWSNAVNVGLVGGIMIGAGRADVFFGLILPHGMLELTAVFVAAGVGLSVGWSWVSPGTRTRAEALGEAGRLAAVVAVGLVGVLLVSGVLEAFVTPSGLPTWARIGVGAVAEVAFLTYVVVLGRRGVRAGETGDVLDAADVAPVA